MWVPIFPQGWARPGPIRELLAFGGHYGAIAGDPGREFIRLPTR
jgi:hypothetical protein